MYAPPAVGPVVGLIPVTTGGAHSESCPLFHPAPLPPAHDEDKTQLADAKHQPQFRGVPEDAMHRPQSCAPRLSPRSGQSYSSTVALVLAYLPACTIAKMCHV